MHGAGNDYVYVDARGLNNDWPNLSRQISDRHFGIGGSTPSIVRELQLSLKQSGHTSRSVGGKNTFPLLTLSAIIAKLDSLETPL